MKGTYCLKILCKNKIKIEVGALGELLFKKGIYLYIGSALNSLEKRIKRHISKNKKIYWHIDYFLKNMNVDIKEIYFVSKPVKMECKTSKSIDTIGTPVKNFGSSDCSCKSHLFFVSTNNIKLAENALYKYGYSLISEIDLKKIMFLL